MDTRSPFRHVDLIASGALTRHHLIDGRFQPLFRGVSVDRDVVVTMAVRAAGAVLLHPHGVVSGLAAAALWGADLDLLDVTVDLAVGSAARRSRPGLRLHRRELPDHEVAIRQSGLRVTTPARTAYDLARALSRGDAVLAIDALATRTGLGPDEIRAVAAAHPGDRDVTEVEPVLAWVDVRSWTVMQSRRRVGLLARGLPRPLVDQRLLDGDGDEIADLGLAWPEARTGITGNLGTSARARQAGWEVLETGVAAPFDQVAAWVRRSIERWDRVPRSGMPRPLRLPPPPEPGGVCDGGLSRLVPVPEL